MTLEATFSLTPRAPNYYVQGSQYARLYVYGADFYPNWGNNLTYEGLYADDRFFFDDDYAADRTLDYTDFHNRRKARHIQLTYDLSALGANKELALIFGFEVRYTGTGVRPRLLIYTSGGLLSDVTLIPGDNQFLMEVESLDYLNLYFIHAQKESEPYGDDWFFHGISGYVI